eukprot:2038223-Prymnesium_polylepis.1
MEPRKAVEGLCDAGPREYAPTDRCTSPRTAAVTFAPRLTPDALTRSSPSTYVRSDPSALAQDTVTCLHR